jgi:RecB family exonuclease
MVWSSTVDERSAGEPSRYIMQLDYESPHEVEKDSITVDVNLPPREPVVVEKEPGKIPRQLSPSLFYSYVECPLKFYFRAVARLRPDEEPAEEIDNALFGNILHHAMRQLYAPLVGVANPRSRIRTIIGSEAVTAAVDNAIAELCPKEEGVPAEDRGGAVMLVHKTIVDYIDRQILPFDAGMEEGYTIVAVEHELSAPFDGVVFRGFADRIDKLPDGTLRVVDYKTGSPDNTSSALLQMRLYAMMLATDENAAPGRAGNSVEAVLYYIREMSKPDYRPLVVEPDPEMEAWLGDTLRELFDPAVPFAQTADPKTCGWCDFRAICGR